jgi:hypothetical protein
VGAGGSKEPLPHHVVLLTSSPTQPRDDGACPGKLSFIIRRIWCIAAIYPMEWATAQGYLAVAYSSDCLGIMRIIWIDRSNSMRKSSAFLTVRHLASPNYS